MLEAVTGILGSATILVFFLLNQVKVIDRDDLIYDVANTIGGALLVWYAYLLDSLPFMILNVVWAGFSFNDVLSTLAGRNRKK